MTVTEMTEDAFSRLLATGAESAAVRMANPSHYWAHRGKSDDPAAHYYWEEVPISREEYIAAIGEDLP
jgi:hypothetical protein